MQTTNENKQYLSVGDLICVHQWEIIYNGAYTQMDENHVKGFILLICKECEERKIIDLDEYVR